MRVVDWYAKATRITAKRFSTLVEVEPKVADAPQREPVLPPVEDVARVAAFSVGRRAHLAAREARALQRLEDDLDREVAVV